MSHIHDKIDFTVEVFIVSRGTILLHKHQKLGKWLSIGGHIELDEDPVQASHREVKEEMGIGIDLIAATEGGQFEGGAQDLPAPMYLNRNQITETHDHITFVYFARPHSTQVKPEDGITDWRWFTRREVEQNDDRIPADIQWYSLRAIETID